MNNSKIELQRNYTSNQATQIKIKNSNQNLLIQKEPNLVKFNISANSKVNESKQMKQINIYDIIQNQSE